MRIGWISQALPYLPARDGFRLFGANLIRELATRHDIDLIALLADERDPASIHWAEQHCNTVTPIAPRKAPFTPVLNIASSYLRGRPLVARTEVCHAIRKLAGRWDVLHVEGALAGGWIPPGLRIPAILSVHDSDILRCNEILACALPIRQRISWLARRTHSRRYETLVLPRFDVVTVVGERDRSQILQAVPTARVRTIPLGVDTETCAPRSEARDPLLIAFHGNLSYPPNVDAAVHLCRGVLPLIRREIPGCRALVAGAHPVVNVLELQHLPGVETAFDVADIPLTLSRASLYVSTVRRGSGAQNKTLEAMAMGLPVVSYARSAPQGDPGVYVGESEWDLARCAAELLRNPAMLHKASLAARDSAVTRHGWRQVAAQYEELYKEVIGRHTGAQMETAAS